MGTAGTVLGWVGVLVATVGTIARAADFAWQSAIVAAAFSPYLMLAAVPAAGLLAWRRAWIGVSIAFVLVLWTVFVQAPLFTGGSGPGGGVPLVLLQANLRLGSADPAAIVHRVGTQRVDVLTVDELTPAAVAGLAAAGIARELPYRLVAPYSGGAGTGIWSRYPIADPIRDDTFSFAVLAGRIAIPRARSVQVYAVHLLPPWPYPPGTWRREMARLRGVLAAAARGSGPVILGGDLNSTLDNARLRRLVAAGYRDAAEQSGAGFAPTYPADRFFPPVLTLDHVLIHDARASSVISVRLPGSDHRGLLARLVLPTAG